MIRPTPRFLTLVAIGFAAAGLPVMVSPSLWWVIVLYDLLLCAAFGYDAIMSARANEMDMTVQAPVRAYVGNVSAVTANLTHQRFTPRDVELRVDAEGPLDFLPTVAAEGNSATWEYRPTNRGTVQITGASALWRGPLGLSCRSKDFDVTGSTTVVPDIQSVRRAALRLTTHHTFLSGLKTRRFSGDGSEFEALRKYQAGLDHRLIDWKASAKHRRLLCRENRSERNHRVVLALDTGRLMRDPIADVPKLDHAINAGLLLAYLSLRMGDRVGVLGFDTEVHAYLAPQSGIRAFQKLTQVASDLPYSDAEANYTLALTELSQRLRRRSIVVVLTDFVDTITAELMIENIDRLAKRHLVVFVAIRDPELEALVNAPPDAIMDINRATVAHEMLREREQVINRLRRLGVFCIDCEPSELSVELINRYLDIHRRELV